MRLCCAINHFNFTGSLVVDFLCCLTYALLLISFVKVSIAENCFSKWVCIFSHHRHMALELSQREVILGYNCCI